MFIYVNDYVSHSSPTGNAYFLNIIQRIQVVDIWQKCAIISLEINWGSDSSRYFFDMTRKFNKQYPPDGLVLLGIDGKSFDITQKVLSFLGDSFADTSRGQSRGKYSRVIDVVNNVSVQDNLIHAKLNLEIIGEG